MGWSRKEVLSGDPGPDGEERKTEPGLGRYFDVFIRGSTVTLGLKPRMSPGDWAWEISTEAWSFRVGVG